MLLFDWKDALSLTPPRRNPLRRPFLMAVLLLPEGDSGPYARPKAAPGMPSCRCVLTGRRPSERCCRHRGPRMRASAVSCWTWTKPSCTAPLWCALCVLDHLLSVCGCAASPPHLTAKPVAHADFVVAIEIEGQSHNVYVAKRPHVDEFLEAAAQMFELVLFTASLSKVAALGLVEPHSHVPQPTLPTQDSCRSMPTRWLTSWTRAGTCATGCTASTAFSIRVPT